LSGRDTQYIDLLTKIDTKTEYIKQTIVELKEENKLQWQEIKRNRDDINKNYTNIAVLKERLPSKSKRFAVLFGGFSGFLFVLWQIIKHWI
jgi:hypothetical protein